MKNLHPNVYKTVILYVGGIIVIFAIFWLLLGLVLPEMNISLVKALSNVLGLDLPDEMISGKLTPVVTFVMAGMVFFSILLLIIHVLFEAFITAQLISPKLSILTSRIGVLSNSWSEGEEHILVRLLNYEKVDLVDIQIKGVFTIREDMITPDGTQTSFMAHIPIKRLTPKHVLVMHPRMPWTIAIPANQQLKHTLNPDYRLNLGHPITAPVKSDCRLLRSDRRLEILVKGRDTRTSSQFSSLHMIALDTQDGDQYTLHLHKGKFCNLPLHVSNKEDINCVE